MNEAIIISLIGAVVSLASVVAVILKSRGENANAQLSAKTALDAQIDARVDIQLKTAWEKLDELEEEIKKRDDRENKRTQAITRILRAIAKQWHDENGPLLDPADIAQIEETIPPSWIRRPTST